MDHDPPIYASHVAGMTGMGYHAQLFCLLIGDGLADFFAQAVLEL
jgi:hypothetical protein